MYFTYADPDILVNPSGDDFGFDIYRTGQGTANWNRFTVKVAGRNWASDMVHPANLVPGETSINTYRHSDGDTAIYKNSNLVVATDLGSPGKITTTGKTYKIFVGDRASNIKADIAEILVFRHWAELVFYLDRFQSLVPVVFHDCKLGGGILVGVLVLFVSCEDDFFV